MKMYRLLLSLVLTYEPQSDAPCLMLPIEKVKSEKEFSGLACTFELDGESSSLLGLVAAAIAAATSAKIGKPSAIITASTTNVLAGKIISW
ncbi:hypothetical protein VNO77_04496 [Canavalia gladiata]|uniref:Uncharacterized protein n=1 Tax=Canavalia gladiata TaxID=3824 RepID=A0AAN9MWM4_CANGL